MFPISGFEESGCNSAAIIGREDGPSAVFRDKLVARSFLLCLCVPTAFVLSQPGCYSANSLPAYEGELEMTKTNGLSTMSCAQLLELRDRVDAALTAARAAEKRELRAKMEALVAKAGLTLDDVLNPTGRTSSSKLRGRKVATKYRNPKDASQTWTGRGRQPNWLVAALKKGQKLESFLA